MIDRAVLDTHPLVWFAGGLRRKLGKKALHLFDAYERGEAELHVPAPVVLETWFLAQRGTIQVDGAIERWWRRIAAPMLVMEPLLPEDVFAAGALDWDHRDPFDRLIVATAQRLELPLVTADGAVSDWDGTPVLW